MLILNSSTLEKPEYVERVLEVVKNKLCYIIGTVYMHMPLKPNVLDDIEKDVRDPHCDAVSTVG